jgi:sugar lactone lactonase YvrE
VPAVRGQSALDGFNPDANGPVYVVVVQPDGKILIGGLFTTVLGVARNRIARLNPDGTLDSTFNPSANSTVFSLAVQADGKILAAFSTASADRRATSLPGSIPPPFDQRYRRVAKPRRYRRHHYLDTQRRQPAI